MNQAQAMTKLRKLFGSSVAYRTDPKAKKAAERAEASARAKEVLAQRQAATEALNARRDALLAADQEYQLLKARVKTLTQEHERLRWISLATPITVGTNSGIFFSVRAQGDDWDEVIGKAMEEKSHA